MSFKIDTLGHFPITIPDATASQDGVMTAAQAAKIDDLAGGILWADGETSASMYARYLDAGGVGDILMIDNGFYTVDAGDYPELVYARFVCMGANAVLQFANGVTVSKANRAALSRSHGPELSHGREEYLLSSPTRGSTT